MGRSGGRVWPPQGSPAQVPLQKLHEIGIKQVRPARQVRARPGAEGVAGSALREILGPIGIGAQPGAEGVARGGRRAVVAARLRLSPRAHRPCRFEDVPVGKER